MNTRYIAAEYRMSHWAQIMRDREASGLSIRAYCGNAGIHENSYYYWQKKLRKVSCEELSATRNCASKPAAIGFAEVKVSSKLTLPSVADRYGQVSIETDGLRISADSGYPIDKLAALLQMAVRSC